MSEGTSAGLHDDSDDPGAGAGAGSARKFAASGKGPGRVRSAMTPIPRTSSFYARSWRDYLTRRGNDDELPVVRPTVALAGHAFVDEIVLAGFRILRPTIDPQDLQRIERETIAAVTLSKQEGWIEQPATFFQQPPELTDVTLRAVASRRQPYQQLTFESGYQPPAGMPGRQRWLSYTANAHAHAWMLRHDQPRPWLICVHGTSMGRPAIDLALFRARWLHEQLGLNVLFPVLPLHGPRKRHLPKNAALPSEDVMNNVHGAAQSVWDVRRLISWIRTQDDQSPIGITGISLGGYITALVASTQDGLACAVAGVPVVDLVDLIASHAGAYPHTQVARIMQPAKELARIISPLSLQPQVPFEGRFIYAGLADQLVHPREQVQRLWNHWGNPQIKWYPGGHTGFARSDPVQKFLLEALLQTGLVERSRAKT